jgi:hypothetical protein
LRLLDKSLQEWFGSAEEVLRELGQRRDPEPLRERLPPVEPAHAPRNQLDQQLNRGIAWRGAVLVLILLGYLLLGGLVSGTLLMLGMGFLFYGQVRPGRGRRALTAAALCLLALHVVIRYALPNVDTLGLWLMKSAWDISAAARDAVAGWLGPALGPVLIVVVPLVLVVVYVGLLFLPVVAGAAYVSLRRLARQRVLRQAARTGGADVERFLSVFRAVLDSRLEDVDFHLKYAEALFNAGRVREAAVEARLLRLQDPYHFGGNLLLAHAYYQLGLFDACHDICEDYLAVSGYCFKFSELREDCRQRLATA